MVLLHYIIIYYITKLHYSRLFYLICHYYLFSFALSFSFWFHFDILLVLLWPFKFYLILCCICCFVSYLCYCIYYHFYHYLSREISWAKNVGRRSTVSLFFSSRLIWKHVLIFVRLLFFKWTCFKFYLIAILICYLHFII